MESSEASTNQQTTSSSAEEAPHQAKVSASPAQSQIAGRESLHPQPPSQQVHQRSSIGSSPSGLCPAQEAQGTESAAGHNRLLFQRKRQQLISSTMRPMGAAHHVNLDEEKRAFTEEDVKKKSNFFGLEKPQRSHRKLPPLNLQRTSKGETQLIAPASSSTTPTPPATPPARPARPASMTTLPTVSGVQNHQEVAQLLEQANKGSCLTQESAGQKPALYAKPNDSCLQRSVSETICQQNHDGQPLTHSVSEKFPRQGQQHQVPFRRQPPTQHQAQQQPLPQPQRPQQLQPLQRKFPSNGEARGQRRSTESANGSGASLSQQRRGYSQTLRPHAPQLLSHQRQPLKQHSMTLRPCNQKTEFGQKDPFAQQHPHDSKNLTENSMSATQPQPQPQLQLQPIQLQPRPAPRAVHQSLSKSQYNFPQVQATGRALPTPRISRALPPNPETRQEKHRSATLSTTKEHQKAKPFLRPPTISIDLVQLQNELKNQALQDELEQKELLVTVSNGRHVISKKFSTNFTVASLVDFVKASHVLAIPSSEKDLISIVNSDGDTLESTAVIDKERELAAVCAGIHLDIKIEKGAVIRENQSSEREDGSTLQENGQNDKRTYNAVTVENVQTGGDNNEGIAVSQTQNRSSGSSAAVINLSDEQGQQRHSSDNENGNNSEANERKSEEVEDDESTTSVKESASESCNDESEETVKQEDESEESKSRDNSVGTKDTNENESVEQEKEINEHSRQSKQRKSKRHKKHKKEKSDNKKQEEPLNEEIVVMLSPQAKQQKVFTSQRDAVIDEIIATEKSYSNDLKTIIEVFVKPLREKKIISEDLIKKIFINVEVLYNYHSLFVKKLESEEQVNIGKFFVGIAAFLLNYNEYCNKEYLQAAALKEAKKKSQFTAFLDEIASTKVLNGLKIEDMLIKPIQRICKYPLLLRELIKNTPKDHSEMPVLEEAQKKINEIVEKANESKKIAETKRKCAELNELLIGLKKSQQLFAPQRKFEKEMHLKEYKKSGTIREVTLYLFDDILIRTVPKGQKEKVVSFTSIVLLKISKVTVGNGLDGFKFYGGDAKFTLIAESVPELTELNAFIELINSLSNKKVEAGLETSYDSLDPDVAFKLGMLAK